MAEYRQVEERYDSSTRTSNNLPKCYLKEITIDEEWGQRRKIFRFYWYDEKQKRYVDRIFLRYEEVLVKYLINVNPEKMQSLLDNCTFYVYVKKTVNKYTQAVENQVKILNDNDPEMKKAKETTQESPEGIPTTDQETGETEAA